MPAISGHASDTALMNLDKRAWRDTVGQSGMTPTAFAFLIPVFVVVIFCPFLCIFCIRKRQRAAPPVRVTKKPALRRAEARERLSLVTDISNVTDNRKPQHDSTVEESGQIAEALPFSETECAICLSTLHAPSPPEPAKLCAEGLASDAVTQPASVKNVTTSEPEAILKLHVCSHEFHAECLVSWFVLRKTTCPICRASYISKEDMKKYEDEEAAIAMLQEEVAPAPSGAAAGVRTDANGSPISNWRYFWAGESVWSRQGGQSTTQGQERAGRRTRFWNRRRS